MIMSKEQYDKSLGVQLIYALVITPLLTFWAIAFSPLLALAYLSEIPKNKAHAARMALEAQKRAKEADALRKAALGPKAERVTDEFGITSMRYVAPKE